MSSVQEQLEILKAVVAVAAADGVISRSERGLVTALAERIGLGQMALDALIERAMKDRSTHEELMGHSIGDREVTIELLVGAARIDGRISNEERRTLSTIAVKLGVPSDHFGEIYRRGLERADRLREEKFGPG